MSMIYKKHLALHFYYLLPLFKITVLIISYLFWSDWSKTQSRIMRATMDGSKVETLVTFNKQKPTQLTITPADGYIYWVDANNGTLQKIKYDGTGYEFVWKGIGKPFGIAVYDQSIFWSDVLEGTIYRCNSQSNINQKRTQYIERSNGTPKGITVVTTKHRDGGELVVSNKYNFILLITPCLCSFICFIIVTIIEVNGNYSASACGYKNGGCMYLCIPITQYERKCACPSSQTDCIEYG